MRALATICLLLSITFMGWPALAIDTLSNELVYRTNLGRADDVQLLLKQQGASANLKDENGVPLIALAAARKDHEALAVIQALLDAHADINARDNNGQTALFYAAARGNMDVVKLLLSKDINYYAMDKKGDIARTIAYRNGHQDIQQAMDDFVKEQTAKRNTEYQELNKTIEEHNRQQQEDTKKAAQAAELAKQQAATAANPSSSPAPAATKAPNSTPGAVPATTSTPAPAPVDEKTKAAADKQHEQDLKLAEHDLSFHNCAFQYWFFIEGVKQSTELSHDELGNAVDSNKDAAKDDEEKLMKAFQKSPGDVTRVSDSSKQRIFNELNAMPSKEFRHEQGVGKMDDMQTRCTDIAREWDLEPPGIQKPGKNSEGKAVGGGIGGIGTGEAKPHKNGGNHPANDPKPHKNTQPQGYAGDKKYPATNNGVPAGQQGMTTQQQQLGGAPPPMQNPYNVHP